MKISTKFTFAVYTAAACTLLPCLSLLPPLVTSPATAQPAPNAASFSNPHATTANRATGGKTKVKTRTRYSNGWVRTLKIVTPGRATIIVATNGAVTKRTVSTGRIIRVPRTANRIKITVTTRSGDRLKPWKKRNKAKPAEHPKPPQTPEDAGKQQLNPDAGSYWCKSSEWYINNAKPATLMGDVSTRSWWWMMTLLFNDPRCLLNDEGRLEEISDHVWVGNGLGFSYPNPNLTELPVDNPLWKTSPRNPYYKNVDGYQNAVNSLWTDPLGRTFHDTIVNTINTRRATECGLPALPYHTNWVNTLLWAESLGDEGDIEDTYGQPVHIAQILHGLDPFVSRPSTSGWGGGGSYYLLPLSATTGLPITAKRQEVISLSLVGQVSASATTSDFCAINSNTKSVAVRLNAPQPNGDIVATVWLLDF